MSNTRVPDWETHLVLKAVEGDRVAFELLCDLHRPMLRTIAMRMLRNVEDAHDAVQETLLKALRAISDFDPDRPLKPWLSRICTNCCVDLVRSRKRDGDSLDAHEHSLEADQAVDLEAEEAIHHGQIVEAIERLPEKYRRIIFMRHFKHMEVNEIALALKKPEGTIKSWLFRARALLKKDLTPALG